MNGFLVFFAIIGIIVAVFAVVVLAIYAGSFIVVAIKAFKSNVTVLTQVQDEHIKAFAVARKARLAKKRAAIIERKNARLDKKLSMKKQKEDLVDRKNDIKAKKEQARLDRLAIKVEKEEAKVNEPIELGFEEPKQDAIIEHAILITEKQPETTVVPALNQTVAKPDPTITVTASQAEVKESILPDGSVEAESVIEETPVAEENKTVEE